MDSDRRHFLAAAATVIAGMRFAAPTSGENRAGAAARPVSSFPPLKQIDAGVLNVGYADVGPHVAIVIHNYRWRLGLAEGESKYDELETRLVTGPLITVPTITLEGDANGAPHPAPAVYAAKFSGKYLHRNLTGGIGHNLPQEVPRAFADAVIEVDRF